MNAFHRIAVAGLSSALLCLSPTSARAALITFEEFTDGEQLTNQIAGVTFANALVLTAGFGGLNEFEFPPQSGTNVIFDSEPGGITVAFDVPISTFSVYVTYSTALTLSAYDAGNNLLGTIASLYPFNYVSSGNPPNELLQISAPAIAYVTLVGDPSGGSIVADDLSYIDDVTAAVPEPTSMLLLGTGLAGLGARRWRQRKQWRDTSV